jgi:hypothetical protein
VPCGPVPETPRARRRLDPWPRASALVRGALSASPRGPTLQEDGTDEASAKAGGTPWMVPEPGRRGTLSAPGLCRPGLSAASTRSSSPCGALLQATARTRSGLLSRRSLARCHPTTRHLRRCPLAGRDGDKQACLRSLVKNKRETPAVVIPGPRTARSPEPITTGRPREGSGRQTPGSSTHRRGGIRLGAAGRTESQCSGARWTCKLGPPRPPSRCSQLKREGSCGGRDYGNRRCTTR